MSRGRLRIYLGAAPGVGKTVAMLDEGHRRCERGTEVVVGLCETHGRPHTSALLEGLEVVPRRTIDYLGTTMAEMDLDAILARHPPVVLVDELAHTNVPGSRNEKRWQDIDELLAAGIDVISTVNIQHLESLNDAVTSITGVVQRETVPDEVVRAADQIELVDMSPEALRRRMAHGNIYKPEKVDAALANYFRVGNLSALRELALLWLADKVDAGLEGYRAEHGISTSWPTRERIVVALSGGPEGEALLRRGSRIASRLAGGELLGVYATRSDGLASAPLAHVAELRKLTEELGGEFHTVTGDDPASAVLDFARGVNATQILVAAHRRKPWTRMFSHSMAESIIAGADDIDVHVVSGSKGLLDRVRMPRADLSTRRRVLGFVSAVLLPSAVTGVVLATPFQEGLPLVVPIFLLATVAVATIGGLAPAVLAAVLSSLMLNWFFIPPVETLTIADPENLLALLVFVLVGVAVAAIVHVSARRRTVAEGAQREAEALAELSHSLLGSVDQLPLLLTSAVDRFGVTAAAIVGTGRDHVGEVLAATEGWEEGRQYDHEPVSDAYELRLQPAGLAAGERRLFAAFAAHAGAVLQRRELQQSARSAALLARDNQARTALLSAVSHDLRTPLAGIKAAIGSLRSTEVQWSPADEAELKEAIEESVDRLDTLVGNLLDMSRLQAGALVAHPAVVDLHEVIPSTLAALSRPDGAVWQIDPDARRVVADAGLLDRVLGNVAENALRYQVDAPTSVHASRVADRVEIRVVDNGVGVPESELEAIFLPFQRRGDVPAGDGVGLGLAVARGLAEAMGGEVSAEPTPGGGLTVVITLPTPEAARDGGGER